MQNSSFRTQYDTTGCPVELKDPGSRAGGHPVSLSRRNQCRALQ